MLLPANCPLIAPLMWIMSFYIVEESRTLKRQHSGHGRISWKHYVWDRRQGNWRGHDLLWACIFVISFLSSCACIRVILNCLTNICDAVQRSLHKENMLVIWSRMETKTFWQYSYQNLRNNGDRSIREKCNVCEDFQRFFFILYFFHFFFYLPHAGLLGAVLEHLVQLMESQMNEISLLCWYKLGLHKHGIWTLLGSGRLIVPAGEGWIKRISDLWGLGRSARWPAGAHPGVKAFLYLGWSKKCFNLLLFIDSISHLFL